MIRHDLRHAWRSIVRMPVPAAVVIVSLGIGIGIGVNTAVFSCGNTANLVLARASARHREIGVRRSARDAGAS